MKAQAHLTKITVPYQKGIKVEMVIDDPDHKFYVALDEALGSKKKDVKVAFFVTKEVEI